MFGHEQRGDYRVSHAKEDRSSIPDDMVVSMISGSICDRPCSNLLLILFMSVDSPLDQIVAEDKLLMLLLQRPS